jgi:hypothetical protein
MKEPNVNDYDIFAGEGEQVIFIDWLKDHQDEFAGYEQEILAYDGCPEFMYKSADKFILDALQRFKEAGIKEPAKTFYILMERIEQELDPTSFAMVAIYVRIKEDLELIEALKRKDMTVLKKLRERGFID